MPEPIQTTVAGVSLMTLAVAIVGPLAGPYMVILLGSIAGGLWALSGATMQTRKEGAGLILRCVLTAVVLTAVIAGLVEARFGIPVNEGYALVSFAIGMLGNRWRDFGDVIKGRVIAVFSAIGSPKP